VAEQRRTWGGAIRTAEEARALLDQVNAAGVERANMTSLARAVRHAEEVELRPDATRLLPAHEQIAALLPWPGIPRGTTIGVVGSNSLLFLLLAGAMRDGSWVACVGMPDLGVLAAVQDHGIPAERLALVPHPGPDWPHVVSALIDGVDLVAVGVPGPVADGTVRSLQARAREKGTVLVPNARGRLRTRCLRSPAADGRASATAGDGSANSISTCAPPVGAPQPSPGRRRSRSGSRCRPGPARRPPRPTTPGCGPGRRSRWNRISQETRGRR
jgi:hypothetical protein